MCKNTPHFFDEKADIKIDCSKTNLPFRLVYDFSKLFRYNCIKVRKSVRSVFSKRNQLRKSSYTLSNTFLFYTEY